ncbi:anoctamin-3-like isoform X1 [Asterias rubens]|uniref:anoctamin-3-like isoform X1 n=1 Tax=Asterias rubens TaxID=7604 RepID=UPI001455087C|nr:anoctamin-3-like isoform X1 [Asterias rubens]XP_033632206.1 anoctamin-3-like isoform X1 [Asterias rubens]
MNNEPYPEYDEMYGGQPLKLNKLPSLEQNGVDEHKSKKRKKKRKKSPRKAAAATQTITPKRIDYVLVYAKEDDADYEDTDDIEDCQRRAELRKRFKKAAKETEGLEIREKDMVDKVYVLIHCPFSRMCHQAESVNLEMPLEGAAIPKNPQKGCMHKINSLFVTEDEVDFISAPFCVAKRAVFQGIDEPDKFFSPALRSLLVHNILINIDVREKGDTEKDYKDSMRRKGLPFMLMKKVFTDAFIMHEESVYELVEDDDTREIQRELSKEKGDFDAKADPREALHRTWCKSFKFQPLWKIRNYFGEKIAFYFAWAGEMASLLWFPVLMGLAIWGYGLYLSITDYMEVIERRDEITLQRELLIDELSENITLYNRTEDIALFQNLTIKQEDSVFSNIADTSLELLSVFQNSFDSEVTPYFALIICLWGTLFQESWKRKHARLAYEWDVDTYHFSEPDRPEFYGTKERDDPVSSLPDWYYPFHKQFLKFMASFGILVFMALLVISSVVGVIVYRVISAALLSESSSVLRLLVSTVVATLLNSISIMILGKIYDFIAYKLTDWENHRTQSQYDDALIIKLFAFQFVNSYASLFYIAFFRGLTLEGGILYMGEGYEDSCGDNNNCMALLSLQVFVLMIIKPFPKFLKDVIIPWLVKKFKNCCCCGKNKVSDIEASELEKADFLKREGAKPQLGNFTLGEFTEKTIQYGFLMLFSCALPLAPLIAILVLLVDIRVDARRMLWMNRRPIAFISGGIGMWYSILDFLNFAGVVTNAFLIAFTAQWSKDFTIYDKLWVVIAFEHFVLSVKFFIAYVIPDVPSDISLSMRRQRYQISQIMENASNQGPVKSKAGAPVKLAPDFKAYNFVDCDVDKQLGCDNNSADSGQLGNGVVEKKHSLEEHNSDDQVVLDTYVPKLSYAPDGNTYLDQSTKFPETKKKKKKVKKHSSEEIPDDNIVSPHAQLVCPPEPDYMAYNNNAGSGYADYPSADAVYPPLAYSLDYAPQVPNPVYPPPYNSHQNSFF